MDKGTYVIKGPLSPEFLTGRSIILSNSIPHDTIHITNEYVMTRPTNDLVWDTVWKRTIFSESLKAQRFLRNLAIRTREELGLSITAFSLPFDDYEYKM